MRDYVIIGSGMAGFGAVTYLNSIGIKPLVYEQRNYYGGHTASHTFPGGWTFDEGPHISFTKDKRIEKFLAKCVNGEFNEYPARVSNYWHGQWIKHPAQVHLHGLNPDLISNIISEIATLPSGSFENISTYEDWLFASFGETFSRNFPMKYTKKYHTTEAKNLSVDWIGNRIYRPSLKEVIKGALSHLVDDAHYITSFRYPKVGGFASYLKPMVDNCTLNLNHPVVKIKPKEKRIYFKNGSDQNYHKLISSMPLPELISIIEGVPNDIKRAAELLACSELVTVTLGVDRVDLMDAHWCYFYDEDIPFARLSTPHMQSGNNAPAGAGLLQAECYFSKKYKPFEVDINSCIEPVIEGLKSCGILKDYDKIIFKNAMYTRYANVIFDHDCASSVTLIHQYLDDLGINYCGRYGDWAYIWTDQSFISGENAAKKAFEAI